MDFVSDRVANAHVLKILTVVDDATHGSVVVEAPHWFDGKQLLELLSRSVQACVLPNIIRSDNGKENASKLNTDSDFNSYSTRGNVGLSMGCLLSIQGVPDVFGGQFLIHFHL